MSVNYSLPLIVLLVAANLININRMVFHAKMSPNNRSPKSHTNYRYLNSPAIPTSQTSKTETTERLQTKQEDATQLGPDRYY